MVENTKLDIETSGFFQLVEGQTRSWTNQDDSCLDHVWTNYPGKVIKIRNVVRAISDHNVVELQIRIRGKISDTSRNPEEKKKKFQ